MGNLEHRSKRRAKKRNLQRVVLEVVKASALLGVAIAAPNVPMALEKIGLLRARKDAGTIARARKRLRAAGYLSEEAGFLRITQKGERLLQKGAALTAIAKKKKWDGRWRVLIFDIPERRKTIRDRVRRSLLHIGFYRLQDSVWVFPYDCEDFIVLLKADLKIGKDVVYMIVDEMESDARIRQVFGLSRVER